MSKTVTITREQLAEAWDSDKYKLVDSYRSKRFDHLCKALGFPEPTPPEKRWLWVFKGHLGTFSGTIWMTEKEAREHATNHGYTLIGKDPNCLKPLEVSE